MLSSPKKTTAPQQNPNAQVGIRARSECEAQQALQGEPQIQRKVPSPIPGSAASMLLYTGTDGSIAHPFGKPLQLPELMPPLLKCRHGISWLPCSIISYASPGPVSCSGPVAKGPAAQITQLAEQLDPNQAPLPVEKVMLLPRPACS